MRYSSATAALALVLGTLAASAEDTASLATASSPTTVTQQTPFPPAAGIAGGQFPVAPPAVPNLEMLAGNPGEQIGSKDLSRFQEPQIAQANSNIMSKYEVRADRVPLFRVRDVYTHEGLVAYSFSAHPGLRIGNVFNSNSGQAYEAYMEDERLANMADLVDTALAMTVGGDKKEGDAILSAERDAYTRYERSDPLESWENVPKTHSGTPIIVSLEQMQVNWLDVKF